MSTILPSVQLEDFIFTFAHAIDLVGLDDAWHGRRVGLLAAELALAAGADWPARQRAYRLGLLHDCGVSSTVQHRAIAMELEWQGAEAHCIRGEALLARCAPLADLAPVVRHHHTRWETLQTLDLPDTVRTEAALVFLADRIDTLSRASYADRSTLAISNMLRDQLLALSGTLFSPYWIGVFAEASRCESFWLMLDSECVLDYQNEMRAQAGNEIMSWADFKQGAYLLADVIDAKSPFTAEHSLGVARVSRYLAALGGLDDERCEMVEVAGLLHDIGKLQIPDDILDSPCGLNEHDAGVMRAHSFATYMVLKRLRGIDDMARWAAWHHETLDGRGYPFHLQDAQMPPEARIIHVADMYQALAQNRPYRNAMSPDAILRLLRARADRHLLDSGLFEQIERHLGAVDLAAVGVRKTALVA
ncbi:HD-GYP domain-containing protein [Chitinilyticum aquatile]|uniref:HD-GYP domain-containing protein n=1 Tax=Chitinilyticum aquatile TaxID=362520 RepID=UPI00040E95C2|nr:HD domain-containing phosphohydrolase [Chitinilyticum aquatile]